MGSSDYIVSDPLESSRKGKRERKIDSDSCVIRLSVAKNYATVAGLRVAVGAAEAFVQAAPLYLTLWYKREQLAFRTAIFFSTTALAGSLNGLIAYGIETSLDGARGIAAWRWIFIVEGWWEAVPLCVELDSLTWLVYFQVPSR